MPEPEAPAKGALCPSYRMEPGAILLGVVEADGLVAYLDELVVVSPEFVQTASEGRAPEQRFRFSGTCIQGGCGQWDRGGRRCGLIGELTAQAGPREVTPPGDLPECVIRPRCRWFNQQGAPACAVCPEVTRDLGTTAAPPA